MSFDLFMLPNFELNIDTFPKSSKECHKSLLEKIRTVEDVDGKLKSIILICIFPSVSQNSILPLCTISLSTDLLSYSYSNQSQSLTH